ncbi:hypothetical protein BHE74_00023097 [Ensete ventricosum]|uniref:Uncharacterized protein n=1 Tax=Ensete ventricosum TaxID=4639 RepID=A0A426XTM4_ENSVE|nr:hypothetical protein B296_00020250 [Ensete ventricosum]RWV77559.1 hypothetical protein GW17_00061585 [Ensete ventricosum]RWW69312.1 hypothetical protein BHE74_00023097 [Ensete ventricosum]
MVTLVHSKCTLAYFFSICRFWILYRAKQDGPVVLGWRHPWEGHGNHSHGHGHEHEVLPCNLLLKFV